MRDAIIYSGARVVLDKEHTAIKQDAIIFDPNAMMKYTESIIKAVCEEMVNSSEFKVKDEDDI